MPKKNKIKPAMVKRQVVTMPSGVTATVTELPDTPEANRRFEKKLEQDSLGPDQSRLQRETAAARREEQERRQQLETKAREAAEVFMDALEELLGRDVTKTVSGLLWKLPELKSLKPKDL